MVMVNVSRPLSTTDRTFIALPCKNLEFLFPRQGVVARAIANVFLPLARCAMPVGPVL